MEYKKFIVVLRISLLNVHINEPVLPLIASNVWREKSSKFSDIKYHEKLTPPRPPVRQSGILSPSISR